jgi:hypothetical protein
VTDVPPPVAIDPDTGLLVDPETPPVTAKPGVEPLAGHTAKGYPYALPGDALTDWPATSLELANLLDTKDSLTWVSAVPIIAGNWLQRSDYPAFYSIDRQKVVRFRGLVAWQQGVSPLGQVMLNLPVGLRNPAAEYLASWGQGGPVNIVVNVSTAIPAAMPHDPGAGYTGFWVSLSPLTWVAA